MAVESEGEEGAGWNRLKRESSPYLRQHAGNPVDWYPWGEEAFARARAEGRPIFLSVGYSTCHWCHVMERESFSDRAVARLMNRLFVNVKVDREERPDIDRAYMAFVQATAGRGGWPMSVWLTPELRPIFGGTYFPPEDRAGQSGFPAVLRAVARAWESGREDVIKRGERIVEALRGAVEDEAASGGEAGGVAPGGAEVGLALLRELEGAFDARWGGFGGAPKFPHPAPLVFLLHVARGDLPGADPSRASRMVEGTLGAMAAGGIRDHLGGGFHRYSVDDRWHVPHFEKMLYDQALLASVYLEAYQITGGAAHASVAGATLDYIATDLRAEGGGFHSAEDADSVPPGGGGEPREGAYYVWTRAEVESLLGRDEAELFCELYGVDRGGNVAVSSDPHGELRGVNVLHLRGEPGEVARARGNDLAELEGGMGRARAALLEARGRRPRPRRDDKIIVAWNGLAISALACGAQVLGAGRWLDAARGAALFLRGHLVDPATGRLARCYRGGRSPVGGFADDHAALIQGLLDLYEADPDPGWIEWAIGLQGAMDALFLCADGCGYYNASGEDPSLLLRVREAHDGAEPSANSLAAMNLLRLHALTGETRYRDRAGALLTGFGGWLGRVPSALPQMVAALLLWERGMESLVIVGSGEDASTRALLVEARRARDPGRVLVHVEPGGPTVPGPGGEFHRELARAVREPTAHLCRGRACALPVTDPAGLRAMLGREHARG